MRLHRLEMTAFGPFGGHQVVDFDELAGGGLFLLHGPTGAGKTSVLDAVCYALYGSVPGARGRGPGRLRSDHAAEGVAPQVVCEVTLAERRFELTRWAEWWRPKRRGAGTTREQSRVLLRELVGGEWRVVSQRIDEAADLIDRLTGMGAEAFTKLVLLPQGEFATFLRARPDERRPLLQRLFGTDRFEAVEGWLAQRRRDLTTETLAARQRTEQLLARADQARLPEAARSDPQSDPQSDRESNPETGPLEQVAAWLQVATQAAAAARRTVAEADRSEQEAALALQAGRRLLDLQGRHRRVADRASRLAERAPGHAADVERARAASAAAVLAPVLDDLADAEAAAVGAADRVVAAEGAVRDDVPADELAIAADPASRLRELHQELGTLRELARHAEQLRQAREQVTLCTAAEREAATTADRGQAALQDEVACRAALAERRSAIAQVAATLPDRARDFERASTVARDAVELGRQRLQLADQDAAVRAAVDRHQAATQIVLDLRARRLDGMAAELASGLHEGDACPVCGSPDHPLPAPFAAPRVTRDDEAAATARRDAAAAQRSAAEQERGETARRIAALTATTLATGQEQALEARAAADSRRRAAEAARIEEAGLAEQLGVLDEQLAGRRERVAAAQAEATRRASLNVAARSWEIALVQRFPAGSGDDPEVRTGRLEVLVMAWEELADARREVAESDRRVRRARAAARRAAREAGFADLGSARVVALPAAELRALTGAIRAHQDAVAEVRAQLADAELRDAAGQAEPELPALQQAATAARDRRTVSAQQHALATRAASELKRLRSELATHLARTRPLRERFELVDEVSRTVEGGGDNALRMRLSSFVLAARLEQVADAASERLAAMTDGRFTVRHTDEPGRRNLRSGLGLLVADGWTGAERDPGTLSGGETFCTSLALALGLADVVTAESGGMRLETLLVDEGFGSLDDETLEQVLDVVDGLRSGGRSVGLVSHVADLRQRIPSQLEVVKTRTGSTLRQLAAG